MAESDQAKAFGGSRRDAGAIPLRSSEADVNISDSVGARGSIEPSTKRQATLPQPMPEQQHVPSQEECAAEESQAALHSVRAVRAALPDVETRGAGRPRANVSEATSFF